MPTISLAFNELICVERDSKERKGKSTLLGVIMGAPVFRCSLRYVCMQDLVTHRMMVRCIPGLPVRAQAPEGLQKPYHFQAKLLVCLTPCVIHDMHVVNCDASLLLGHISSGAATHIWCPSRNSTNGICLGTADSYEPQDLCQPCHDNNICAHARQHSTCALNGVCQNTRQQMHMISS